MEFDVPCALCHKIITQKEQEATGNGGIITAAEMLNAQSFRYGLSGVFNIQNYQTLGLKTGDQICNQCLKDLEFVPCRNVVCGVCRRHFQANFDLSGNEGDGCSCDVKNGIISGGYGSIYDCIAFTTDLKDMRSICDVCVSTHKKEQR